MRKRKLIVLAAVGVIAAGILTAKAQPGFVPGSPLSPNTMMQAPSMPPPVPTMAVPRSPGPQFVWAPGSWAWNRSGWAWVPGAWVMPPRPGAMWAPGHWNRRGRGSRWVGGSWR
jgi:WXXGXW repeat (2 copies)